MENEIANELVDVSGKVITHDATTQVDSVDAFSGINIFFS